MKTMTRRPSTILSRALLAAFLVTLPGSREAFAQVGRSATAIGSGTSSPYGSVAGQPNALGGITAAPGLSAALAPINLNLSAPAAPGAAAPALMPAALTPSALMPAAAKAAKPVSAAVAAAKALKSEAAAGPSAMAALTAAAAGSKKNDGGASASGERFDGSRGRADGDDDDGAIPKSRALVPVASPAEAPVIALTKIFFPGVNSVRIALRGADSVAMVTKAMRTGGYMIATTLGSDPQGHSATAVLVKLSSPETMDPSNASVLMTVLRPVTITGYKDEGGVSIAKVTYPKTVPSSQARLEELGALAQHTLNQFAPLDPAIDSDLIKHALMEDSVERLTNLIAQEFPFTADVKLQLLQEPSTEARLQAVILEMTAHFKEMSAKAKPSMETGGGGNGVSSADSLKSIEALKAKMQAIGMPAGVQETATAEFSKLSQMNPKDSEAQKARAYLEWLLDVPWSQRTEDNLNIADARRILDKDHFGLEKVKERVLEFLALRKKTGSKKGAIIAFTGPPGVGKTSIAGAIAEALGRKFVRLSLGGVHDETVLRGHGRTYLGSMPGEIMRQMKAAGTINPVMLMDEADKIGRNGNAGDPTAALLEILDPSQNNTYRDRYLDVPYDLSEVLFVVTSNELSNIPEPLRDRMEIIEFDGYTTLEKIAIAERHVVPQKLAVTGLKAEEAQLTKAAIRRIIEGYTMEAGVRKLRQQIESVLRKISAWTETRGEKAPGVVDEGDIEHYLGVESFSPRQVAQNGVGVATGLAVNTFGGSTLNVEVSKEPGSGQLKLRQQFGPDIEDSAKNALKYVKQNAAKFGLKDFDFTKHDIDINITPAGKVDGPSAGGLMVTAIISALTGRSVTPGLAMTGEITMRGDILPIGGLKQKVMAAHRMGYKEVIFPFANLKDIEDIPKEVRDGIKLTPARTYDDIYPSAIVPAKAGKAGKPSA
ncbi:MAG: endopeptidase La [Elusimicrobia bacterium]|nr:endopeptidase La [Elusimicrobiota bacterium]